HVGLPTQAALGTDLACHAGDFRGEGVQLVDHAVDGVLQLEDLAADFDGDLIGRASGGDRGRHVGDVAHLGGEVAGHRVDVVGEVAPGARGARHVRLAAQATLGADLARDARNFGGKGIELIDHDIDRVLQLEDLAADFDGDFLKEVALLHSGRDLGDVTNLVREIVRELVQLL